MYGKRKMKSLAAIVLSILTISTYNWYLVLKQVTFSISVKNCFADFAPVGGWKIKLGYFLLIKITL